MRSDHDAPLAVVASPNFPLWVRISIECAVPAPLCCFAERRWAPLMRSDHDAPLAVLASPNFPAGVLVADHHPNRGTPTITLLAAKGLGPLMCSDHDAARRSSPPSDTNEIHTRRSCFCDFAAAGATGRP